MMIGLSQEARFFAGKLHEAELTIKDHEQCNIRLLAENRKLKSRLESLEKDAARYQWLRESSDLMHHHKLGWCFSEAIKTPMQKQALDLKIDTAMQANKGE